MLIIMVSEKKDSFYNLTHLVPEMMKKEKLDFDFVINYFLVGLDCERYRIFPEPRMTREVMEWILEGDSQ